MRHPEKRYGYLRGAMGGAIGGLIFFLFLGLMGDMFRLGTGYDQAYLIMFTLYFLLPLLALGALCGTITNILIVLLLGKRETQPALIKRLLIGFLFAFLVGAVVALCFGTGNKTTEYWKNFATVVVVFAFTVGVPAGVFAGKRRPQPDTNGNGALT